MFRLYAFAGIFLVLSMIGGSLYYKWTAMQVELEEQKSLNMALQLKTQEQDKVIEQQKQDMQAQIEIRDSLQEQIANENKRIDEVQDKFNKVSKLLGERDFGRLAVAKPNVIEKVVNKGTKNVMRCFEIASGNPLTEEEKAAQKPSQLNTACPDIANPNRVQVAP